MDHYGGGRAPREFPGAPLRVLIDRPRLTSQLDAAPGSVLLTAPAGFGKTTLLQQWTDGAGPVPVWIDGGTPSQRGAVWSAVLAGLRTASVLSAASLRELGGTGGAPGPAFRLLQAALESTPVRLVFDDIDAFSAAERGRWFPGLLNQAAHPVHVIATTRDRSAVNAGQARLSSRLLDITADDLAFTPAETAALAGRLVPGLGTRSLDRVQQHNGGWPACTVLTLRSLQGVDGIPAPPDGMRTLTEYLDRDVLQALTAAEVQLLNSICVCPGTDGTHAGVMSGRADAGTILAGLTDRGLVVVTGRTGSRIRPVLRDYLLETLTRTEPAELRRLHGLAADWHGQAGDAAASLRHATASGDAGRLAAALAKHGVAQVTSGQARGVLSAFSRLPEYSRRATAKLCLVAALAHLEAFEPVTAAPLAAAAERLWPAAPERELRELRALVHARLTWFSPERTPSRRGWADTADLPRLSVDPGIRIEAQLLASAAHAAAGAFSAADSAAAAALAEAENTGNSYLAGKILVGQAFNAAVQGRMREAGIFLARAGGSTPDRPWETLPNRSAAHFVQALGCLLRLEPAPARELSAAARANLGQLETTATGIGAALRAATAILDACALLDGGGGYRALNDLRRARNQVNPGMPFGEPLGAFAAVTEHAAALAVGNTARAREVAGWLNTRLPKAGELCLLRAAAPAGISRFAAAEQRLEPLHNGSAVPVLAWTGIQVSILECSMALRSGRRPLAVEHLVRALQQGDELDVLRPLATAPPEVADLLAERAGSCGAEEETAERVLALRPATARPVPFSPRQQEILSLLPSHLSLGQVASELQLSVNTVKTHVRIIYSKLGATTRHDAVAAAYQRGQLP